MMKNHKLSALLSALILFLVGFPGCQEAGSLTETPLAGVELQRGPGNLVSIERNGSRLTVYGPLPGEAENSQKLLLTHFRRDLLGPAMEADLSGTEVIGPPADPDYGYGGKAYWEEMSETGQYHDYDQQTTRRPAIDLAPGKAVKEGDRVSWEGLSFEVLETPGYSRNAVTYLLEMDGKRIGFTGDLVYGDGRLFDLYSLQDAVPGTRIRGYHGYAGRIGPLLVSLEKIKSSQCDLLIPARGPVIDNPGQAIDLLTSRLRKVYANYLAINAGRWYFKDDYDTLAKRARVSGDVEWMPWAETILDQPPEWIKVIRNTRLIISEDRSAFLVDCGSEAIFDEVKRMQDEGIIKSIDGLFITHYHDDHTEFAARAAEAFSCPVYATEKSADILAHPEAYRLPAMTGNPIPDIRSVKDRYKMKWKEYEFEFFYFPGQTISHDALLVKKDGGETVFFIGDSFSPSGIDDYCLLNRNLLHDEFGYLFCLDLLKEVPAGTLLINQHIVEPFAFTPAQIGLMEETLRKRQALLQELFPWDDPNYGIDEQWARFHPYRLELREGEPAEAEVRIFNHSPDTRTFRVTLNTPEGLSAEPAWMDVTLDSLEEGEAAFTLSVAQREAPKTGTMVVTADIGGAGIEVQKWCEALVVTIP